MKAMEPRESSLRLMLRYVLSKFNPQGEGGASWEVSLFVSSIVRIIKAYLAPKHGGTLAKLGSHG